MRYTLKLISVVVTCYDQGSFLPECLDSLLAQSYENWECIIIDDGSTDNTQKIAIEYCKKDRRFNYIYQENEGVSAARNKGLGLAKGDFIQFIDADDLIHPKKFSTQIEFTKTVTSQTIVFGSSKFFFQDDPDKLFSSHYNGGIPSDLNCKDLFQVEFLLYNNACSNCAPLYPKIVAEKIWFKKCIYEDWVFNLECALLGLKFHFFNDPNCTSYVRMTDSSQMIRHTTDLEQVNKFKSLLLHLTSTYNYNLDPRYNMAFKLKSNGLKRLVKGVTPPFLYDFLSQLKSKI